MKILVIEDDQLLADAIVRNLRAENFVVDHASNGEDGQHLGETGAYDAAVLDLGLPKVSGIAVLRAWRAADRKLPVLILTARERFSPSCFLTEELHRGGSARLQRRWQNRREAIALRKQDP
jgi:DNA-binding response OmpR family regulator